MRRLTQAERWERDGKGCTVYGLCVDACNSPERHELRERADLGL